MREVSYPRARLACLPSSVFATSPNCANYRRLIMSGPAHGENSGSGHRNQIVEETVFCNTNSNKSEMFCNSVGLMNHVPKKCEKNNDHKQSVKSTTSDQSLLQSSAGGNVCFKSMVSIQLNPVGSLQELCMVRHYPFPYYTFSDENFKTQEERFTAICSISTYSSSGRGISKQEAKKEAAYLMYKQIEKLTSKDFHHNINDNTCEFNDESCNVLTFHLCHESVTSLKTFFDSKDAPKTPHLQNIKKNSNEFKLMTATDTLKTISEKEDFTYKCVMISQNCDEVEVLMQVNTNPVIVISKSGKNNSDAEESAALIVLTYFKLRNNI